MIGAASAEVVWFSNRAVGQSLLRSQHALIGAHLGNPSRRVPHARIYAGFCSAVTIGSGMHLPPRLSQVPRPSGASFFQSPLYRSPLGHSWEPSPCRRLMRHPPSYRMPPLVLKTPANRPRKKTASVYFFSGASERQSKTSDREPHSLVGKSALYRCSVKPYDNPPAVVTPRMSCEKFATTTYSKSFVSTC